LRSSLVCLLFVSLAVGLATPALSATQTYTVVAGDTLTSIAQHKHVSVAEIVRLNNLSNADYLREGQVLQLGIAGSSPRHSGRHSLVFAHATVKRRHVGRTSKVSASRSNPVAERQLWVAMHSGFSASDFGARSFAAAQKAIVLELALTKTALRYLGVPYVWGGESASGVDCSGFVQAVFRRNGIELPRTADAQFETGHRVSESGLQPGDLVFFQTYSEGASHVGIYLGSGQFVHASSSSGVRVDSLSESYYSSRFIGARRTLI
jgi:cell wall-associated NlpC family hydrolase